MQDFVLRPAPLLFCINNQFNGAKEMCLNDPEVLKVNPH